MFLLDLEKPLTRTFRVYSLDVFTPLVWSVEKVFTRVNCSNIAVSYTGLNHGFFKVFPAFYITVISGSVVNGISTAMKFSDDVDSATQSITQQYLATGQISTADADRTVVMYAEQPAEVIEVEREDLTAFFAVGIVVNIVMITAYFVWAYRQWDRSGTSDE